MIRSLFLLFTACVVLLACERITDPRQAKPRRPSKTAEIQPVPIKLEKDYWYSGKAELTRYDLDQSRYGQQREGHVVKIFVTEDFLTDEQVKNDTYTNDNSVSVLKMNDIRRFTTGLYDYSIMTSVFTRADGTTTEKVTLSSQDWCGQTWVQLNWVKGNKYKLELRSYFETEGDREITIVADLLEDELFNLIRIDPELIPSGEVEVLPSLTSLRFSHSKHEAIPATITKSNELRDDIPVGVIKVTYPEREITIAYNPNDQNKIVSWSETPDNTTGKLTHELYEAYWKMNGTSYRSARSSLGLE